MIHRLRQYVALATEACGRATLIRLHLLQISGAVLEAVVLALLVPVVQLLSGAAHMSLPVIGLRLGAVATILTAVIALVLRALVQWLATVQSTDVRLRTTDHARLRAMAAVLDADWPFLARRRRSDIVQATTTEIQRVATALELAGRVGVDTLILVATAVVGIAISPALGAIVAVALVPVLWLGRRSVRRSVDLGVEWSRRNTLFGATVTDSLSALRLIRAHNSAAVWKRLLDDAAAAGRRVEQRYIESAASIQTGLALTGIIAAMALVALGRWMGMGAPALLTLAVITVRLLGVARLLLQTAQAFAHYAPALDNVDRLLADAAAHPAARSNTPVPAPDTGTPLVALHDVSAGYGEQPAIRHLDITVPEGAMVAVSGPSGAGKSTLLDVVLGLLPVRAGSVRVRGEVMSDAWRELVGYVPQQNLLLPGTVRENLTWSAPDRPDDDALWAALEAACVDDVVHRLPSGLDTPLHDTTQLSGGEQQRLCIARALARDPQLLVLDEATSALDADTEKRVVTRLRDWSGSVLIATHRSAVLALADSVVHLEGGTSIGFDR